MTRPLPTRPWQRALLHKVGVVDRGNVLRGVFVSGKVACFNQPYPLLEQAFMREHLVVLGWLQHALPCRTMRMCERRGAYVP